MEHSGFFDAEELVSGEYDREYVAEQYADYFKLFIGNGVFVSPTNQLKVVAGLGMNVTIKEGWAFINGYWYHNDSDLTLSVPANTTAQDQTYGVFVQFDSSTRDITSIVATRNEVDRTAPIYELKLADIAVATGATSITNSDITDTRSDESVCGFVSGLIDVIPTNDLFEQFTDMFETWFDHMKDQLSEDAAGHLQNEIDDLQNAVEVAAGVWTAPISCAIGDTSVTFTNANILTTSTIDYYTQNASGNPVGASNVAVTTGQAVLTFDALEEATDFKLHIMNV